MGFLFRRIFVINKKVFMDNLENQLAKVVEKSLQLAEKTGDFVIEQAPSLLQEFYMWHIVSSIFWIILGLLIAWGGTFLPLLWAEKVEKDYALEDYEYFYKGKVIDKDECPPFLTNIIFCSITSLIVLSNLYDLIKIIVAPKIYLIEYFIHH